NLRPIGYEPIALTNCATGPEKNRGGGDRSHDLSGMNRTLSPAELRSHMAPHAVFEPATVPLTADCSTAELLRFSIVVSSYFFIKIKVSLSYLSLLSLNTQRLSYKIFNK